MNDQIYRREGMEASEKGFSRDACPYFPYSLEGRSWMDGWQFAEDFKFMLMVKGLAK